MNGIPLERFTRYIVRRTIAGWDNADDPRVRHAYAAMEGWVSIAVNVILAIVKGIFGAITGSVALTADAVHTLSDVSTSVVILVSFRIAKKPSDAAHPFGHGRMEAVGTVIVAVLLMVIGIEIGKGAVERLIHPQPFEASWVVMLIILATIIVKELLARFSRILGAMIDASSLHADFWHHRSDAISSALVLIAFIGQRFGWVYLDGVAGLLVAAMIVYTGWKVVKEGIDDLLGKKPSPELIRDVKSAVKAFPEILGIHELIVHDYGNERVMSFHIQVSDEMALKDVHDLSEKVEEQINTRFRTHATVHCDPVNIRDPDTRRARSIVGGIIEVCDCASYHDLRITESGDGRSIVFDLMVDSMMKEGAVQELTDRIRTALFEAFSDVTEVNIEIEPMYAV